MTITIEQMRTMLVTTTDPRHRKFLERQIAAEEFIEATTPKCPVCGYYIAPDGYCTDCLLKGRA